MNQHNRRFVRLGALVLTVLLAAPAAGQEAAPAEEARATVPTAGLDLSRAADAEVLYERIRTAAISLCRGQRALWDVKRMLHQQQCIERTLDEVVDRVDLPLLTAVHSRVSERVAGR